MVRSEAESIPPTGGVVETEDTFVSVDIDEGALATETSISITEDGEEPQYQISTNAGNGTATYGVSLGPDGQTFAVPVTLTFKWSDDDNDGKVDGSSVKEKNLRVVKDNQTPTDRCDTYSSNLADLSVTTPVCNQDANIFYIQVSSFSDFNLFILDADGDQIADVDDNCPSTDVPYFGVSLSMG